MSNEEWVKSLTREELSDYIYSVFVAGKMYGRGLIKKEDLIDYRTWLNEEHEN